MANLYLIKVPTNETDTIINMVFDKPKYVSIGITFEDNEITQNFGLSQTMSYNKSNFELSINCISGTVFTIDNLKYNKDIIIDNSDDNIIKISYTKIDRRQD